MKKRIMQPTEDLFSEVVVEPDATDTTSKHQPGEGGVQVDSPQLIELGAFFDASLADDDENDTDNDGGITVEPPAIETCEPQAIETKNVTTCGDLSRDDIDRFVRAAKDAFDVLARAFRTAEKAITKAVNSPAFQEVIKAAADEIANATYDPGTQEAAKSPSSIESAMANLPANEPPEKKRKSKATESPRPDTSPVTQVFSDVETAPGEPTPEAIELIDTPAITDVWDTPLVDTEILQGIKRFGDQRKQSVIDTCPTVGDLYRQINGKGLKKVEGIGGKIAEQIAANFESWREAAELTGPPTGGNNNEPKKSQP